MELHRIDVHRLVGDRLPRLGEVDQLGDALLHELGIGRAQKVEHPADRILGQVGELGPGQQFDHLGGQIGPDLVGPDCALFSHFHLLTQLVANALQAFAHRSVIHSGVRRESRRAPAAVVSPIAELPFFRRQREQRVRQPNPLRLGPPRLRLVQDWNIRDLVQRQKRPSARPPHVERRCDDDATEPTGERGRHPAGRQDAGTRAGRLAEPHPAQPSSPSAR